MINQAYREPGTGEDVLAYLIDELRNTIRNIEGGSNLGLTSEKGDVALHLDETLLKSAGSKAFTARITDIPNLTLSSAFLNESLWTFNYSFVQVELIPKETDEGDTQIIDIEDITFEFGGIEGLAINIPEINHGKKHAGRFEQLIYGVNVGQPSFFNLKGAIKPVPPGAIYIDADGELHVHRRTPVVVEMHEYLSPNGDIIYWFDRMGTYDGVCTA